MNLNINIQKNKILALIFTLTFLLYGNTIKNNYSLDDNYVTVTSQGKPNNPRIAKGIYGIPEIFATHYVESKKQSFEYRPMALATFALEYQLFGRNPHFSHFFNVLIYAINNIILFLILARLFKSENIIFPLLITILFVVHPIHTEVVASIKSRDELLSFLFGLCSLFFALKYFESKHFKYVLIFIVFLIMALLCKKTAMLFMGLIPLTYYYFYDVKPKQFLLLLSFILLSLICFALFKKAMLNDHSTTRIYAFFENPLFYEENILTRIPFALYSIGYYLKLLIFPYPLCCYYGYSTIPFVEWTNPLVFISIIFHIGLVWYVVKHIKEKNIISYGIIIYLIGILPFSNMISLATGIIAERYIYFASLGFCIAAVYLLSAFFKNDIKNIKINSSFSFIMITIFVLYSGLSISRNSKWFDEITLFKNDCKNFKNSCNLQYITGNKLYTQIFSTPSGAKKDSLIIEMTNHFKQALRIMEEGVKKYPQDYTTLNNIGTIYTNIFDDGASAQPFFKRSIALNPTDNITQFNYAFCFEKRNLPDSAIYYYEKLILLKTDYLPVYSQLRELYLKKLDFSKVIECDKKAININPLDAKLYVNLGNSYISNKDTLSGIIQFEKAVEIEPSNSILRDQIVFFLNSAGYSQKAQLLKKRFAH